MSDKILPEGLSTEQEFAIAIEILGRCTGTLRCGCDISGAELDAILLKYRCKDYIKAIEDYPG